MKNYTMKGELLQISSEAERNFYIILQKNQNVLHKDIGLPSYLFFVVLTCTVSSSCFCSQKVHA